MPFATIMQLLRHMYKQINDWTCGPAVARIILHFHFSRRASVSTLIRQLKTTRRGTDNRQLVSILKKHGIRYRVHKEATLSDIKKFLPRYLVVLSYWIPAYKESHFSIVRRLDAKRIYFHDTWFGARHSYSRDYFTKRCWKEKEYRWLLLIPK